MPSIRSYLLQRCHHSVTMMYFVIVEFLQFKNFVNLLACEMFGICPQKTEKDP